MALNGREALELLRARPFDLMLLDVMMPEMNGYEVLEALKADPRFRNLPVIMISALDQIESVIRCIELGAADSLPKPFRFEDGTGARPEPLEEPIPKGRGRAGIEGTSRRRKPHGPSLERLFREDQVLQEDRGIQEGL